MIVKAWCTKECKRIDEVEVDTILIASEDRAEALECIENDWAPMITARTKDGRWISYPVQFVIEIKEE